jgi:branched-chain amino acid transport system ATP-binding protein
VTSRPHPSGGARGGRWAPVFEARDVTVRFGGLQVLDHVTVTAAAGAVTGVIGPNGAGKTTLFNVITGLMAPSSGRVVLAGRDLTRLSPARRARAGLARTFQVLQLFGTLTVRENVELAARTYRAAYAAAVVEYLLDLVGMTEFALVPAQELTTGQGRLVELARALATRPRLLLLDEPASGLDDHETRHLTALLRTIVGDETAILLVEHHVPTVMELCDTIHVLDYGRHIAAGSPAQIRNSPAVQAAYLGAPPSPPRRPARPAPRAGGKSHDRFDRPAVGPLPRRAGGPR